tara:strand:+ start:196 stop:573 length:378 start_codon:yes stop_codon:yes gene_type:complete
MMALPQHLIDMGYEEVSSDRDESRSIKMVDGYCVYLTSDQQNELDAFRKTLEDEKPTIAWARLRRDRDRKLAATDWRAMPDLTLSDAWKTYRQALRDLPASYDDTTVQKIFRGVSGDIDWPTEPS